MSASCLSRCSRSKIDPRMWKVRESMAMVLSSMKKLAGFSHDCSHRELEAPTTKPAALKVLQVGIRKMFTNEAVFDDVMKAIHTITLEERQSVLLDSKQLDDNGTIAACESCTQNLDDTDFFVSFLNHIVTAERAITDEDKELILYEALEVESVSLTVDKQENGNAPHRNTEKASGMPASGR